MVYHVMNDGSIIQDITGKVVKVEDAKPAYNLFNIINKKPKDKTKEEETNVK